MPVKRKRNETNVVVTQHEKVSPTDFPIGAVGSNQLDDRFSKGELSAVIETYVTPSYVQEWLKMSGKALLKHKTYGELKNMVFTTVFPLLTDGQKAEIEQKYAITRAKRTELANKRAKTTTQREKDTDTLFWAAARVIEDVSNLDSVHCWISIDPRPNRTGPVRVLLQIPRNQLFNRSPRAQRSRMASLGRWKDADGHVLTNVQFSTPSTMLHVVFPDDRPDRYFTDNDPFHPLLIEHGGRAYHFGKDGPLDQIRAHCRWSIVEGNDPATTSSASATLSLDFNTKAFESAIQDEQYRRWAADHSTIAFGKHLAAQIITLSPVPCWIHNRRGPFEVPGYSSVSLCKPTIDVVQAAGRRLSVWGSPWSSYHPMGERAHPSHHRFFQVITDREMPEQYFKVHDFRCPFLLTEDMSFWGSTPAGNVCEISIAECRAAAADEQFRRWIRRSVRAADPFVPSHLVSAVISARSTDVSFGHDRVWEIVQRLLPYDFIYELYSLFVSFL